jgi:hypothetical protein
MQQRFVFSLVLQALQPSACKVQFFLHQELLLFRLNLISNIQHSNVDHIAYFSVIITDLRPDRFRAWDSHIHQLVLHKISTLVKFKILELTISIVFPIWCWNLAPKDSFASNLLVLNPLGDKRGDLCLLVKLDLTEFALLTLSLGVKGLSTKLILFLCGNLFCQFKTWREINKLVFLSKFRG